MCVYIYTHMHNTYVYAHTSIHIHNTNTQGDVNKHTHTYLIAKTNYSGHFSFVEFLKISNYAIYLFTCFFSVFPTKI